MRTLDFVQEFGSFGKTDSGSFLSRRLWTHRSGGFLATKRICTATHWRPRTAGEEPLPLCVCMCVCAHVCVRLRAKCD